MRKLFIIFVLIFLVLPVQVSAAYKQNFSCTSLTGGTVGALDYYNTSGLHEGDETHCFVSGDVLHFRFDVDGTNAENTTTHPYYVRPDDYASGGVWVEQVGSSGSISGGNWKTFYTDGSGNVNELALGSDGKYLKSTGTTAEPEWAYNWFGNAFYPDASASDQGATDATYLTVKEIVDAVGSSEKATIVFRHTGAANTTTYTFGTAEVITANITVMIEPGAVFADHGNVNLTITGTFVAVREKCFDWDGTGKVYFASSIENSKTGVVFPEWWGALPDGDATRDDLAFQKASDSFNGFGGIVDMDQGVYHFEGSVKPGMGVVFQGKGFHVPPFEAARDPVNLEAGTWIWIDATGFSPFDIESGGQTFRDFGMAWLHDAPGAGWAPTAYPAAFYLDETNGVNGANDVKFYNVMMLNPYIGISQPTIDGSSLGRLEIDHLFGQPFAYGLSIENMSDVCRISNVHFWPYWSSNSNVQDWTKANGRAIAVKRMDQPEFNNIFALSYLSGFYFDEEDALTPDASSYGVQINNANLDWCKYGIYVETTDTNGLNINLNNSYISGGSPITDSKGIYVAGSSTHIRLNNVQMLNVGEEFVSVGGSGNYFSADNIDWNGWNFDNGGHGSMNITAGNYGNFGSQRIIAGGQYGATISYGGGTIKKGSVGYGSWVSKSFNTQYTAATDGMVVAHMYCSNDPDWGSIWVETPVGTARVYDSQHYSSSAPNYARRGGVTCPVKAGDTWKVNGTSAYGVSFTVWWIPTSDHPYN